MITRTGVLLVLAVGAWAAGGVVAVHEHWHPFSERHSNGRIAFRKVASGRTVVVSGRPLVRLTEAERAMLPRGYPVKSAEDALSRALAWELNERTAAHAVRDPASRAVMLSDQLVSVRARSIHDFDPMVLWPGVASRLEAAGTLPPHVHSPGRAVIHARPARRGSR